ncbi:MAG: PepSY-like domain-containing protein, partial [Sedimentisphaerales bacterium]|nr:PepSY-like domain-containing protein [Sedimentisphaerales bacterium]
MKKEYCKVISLIILVAVLICTIVYAEECSKKDALPSAAQAVVEKMYPNRELAKIEAEEESLKLYEVDFADGGSMVISAEGTVVSIETKESLQSIPSAVAESISQAVKGADIKKIEKEVIYAEIKLAELGTQKTVYEAKMNKDGREIEVKVDASGVILGIEKKDEDGD